MGGLDADSDHSQPFSPLESQVRAASLRAVSMAEASDLAFVETWIYVSFLPAQFGLNRETF
jgi:hypothetical protein